MPNLLARVDIAETADFLGDDRSAQLRRAEAAIDRTIAVASIGYLIQNQADLLRNSKRPIEAIHEYFTTKTQRSDASCLRGEPTYFSRSTHALNAARCATMKSRVA
jgi:hypothetical protein